ncbi:MAG: DUF4928 family protein [Opitutaceae bacterium]|jgi:hypothetical protein
MPKNLRLAVHEWLASCTRKGKISRNTLAAGLVVLDRLQGELPLKNEALFSEGGELRGIRGMPWQNLLKKHDVPIRFLKEATTRQVAQDAKRLLQSVEYGGIIGKLSETEKSKHIKEGVNLILTHVHAWLGRTNLRITCRASDTPESWIGKILAEAAGRSGGTVEQHLVGAKLQARFPSKDIPNLPSHAGDAQTGRDGDFVIDGIAFHVTAAPGRSVLLRCRKNLEDRLRPVLIVPRSRLEGTRGIAEDENLATQVQLVALEDFIAANVLEIAIERNMDVRSLFQALIEDYNNRLRAVETDHSLTIELR